MKMIPSYCDLADNVYTSSVKYSRIDTEGNNHNIERGIDITETLEIVSDNQIQIRRRKTQIFENRL